MKQHIAPDPEGIGLGGTGTVVASLAGEANGIEEAGLGGNERRDYGNGVINTP